MSIFMALLHNSTNSVAPPSLEIVHPLASVQRRVIWLYSYTKKTKKWKSVLNILNFERNYWQYSACFLKSFKSTLKSKSPPKHPVAVHMKQVECQPHFQLEMEQQGRVDFCPHHPSVSQATPPFGVFIKHGMWVKLDSGTGMSCSWSIGVQM